MLAGAQAGRYQIADATLPHGGTLRIGDFDEATLRLSNIIVQNETPTLAALDPTFSATTSLTDLMSELPEEDPDNVFGTTRVSSDLVQTAGFQAFELSGNAITIDADVDLAVAPTGTIDLRGSKIMVNGSLTARSGTIDLTARNGDIIVASGATLDASGQWVNDTSRGIDEISGTALLNGGTISLRTLYTQVLDETGDIVLQAGSVLDVSSGGYVQQDGTLLMEDGIVQGRGGSIGLQVSALPTTGSSDTWVHFTTDPETGERTYIAPTAGQLDLSGTLRSHGSSGGGTLSLAALHIQVGGEEADAHPFGLYLPETFFDGQGFGAYALSSIFETTVAPGAQVTIRQRNLLPNYQALLQASTGTDLHAGDTYTRLGTLDDYHREATDLSIATGVYRRWYDPANYPWSRPDYAGETGALTIGEGAALRTDAGAAVSLSSYDQINILGAIHAPGGSITATGNRLDVAIHLDKTDQDRRSIWLGADSLLNVSGISLIDDLVAPVRGAQGAFTPRTGRILGGGTVSLTDEFGYVIAEDGARIDVSGASDAYDILQPTGDVQGGATYRRTDVWSDGGSVRLGGTSGLLFDGTIAAHGGSDHARGGSLTILAGSSRTENAIGIPLQGVGGILVTQTGDFVDDALAPGDLVEGTPGFASGIARFAVDTLDDSGIDDLALGSLNLSTMQVAVPVAFAGDVDLSLRGRFTADARAFVALPDGATTIPAIAEGFGTSDGTNVRISAAYVRMGGDTSYVLNSFSPVLAAGDATLDVDAREIDLTGTFALQNFGDASFTSAGDIRFYAQPDIALYQAGAALAPGKLVTSGDLTFKAAQLYPTTASNFIIAAVAPVNPDTGERADTTITILPNGSSSVPLSAGGSLHLDASHIVQGGTLRAPAGTIVLGVSDQDAQAAEFAHLPTVLTQSVTLLEGSRTSVSLEGASVLYGETIDGIEWQYQIGGDALSSFPDLLAPPAKRIALNGADVELGEGATLDISGGGDLIAPEWIAGTGGSRDLLARYNTDYSSGNEAAIVPLYPDARNIYAILPGAQGIAAPYDPSIGTTGEAVGRSVYLSGVEGLADGVYTLLPARYATMEGAYRVVVNSGATDTPAGARGTMADGTQIVGGWFVDGATGARDARTTSFSVQARDVWRQYSEYTLTSANDYFPDLAAEKGMVTPRLPTDAGRISVGATATLDLGATITAAAGKDGRGGEFDIASQAIQVVDDLARAQDGYLVLTTGELNDLGVASLLLGGQRSDTAAGQDLAVLANSVLVSTSGASPLAGAEIILAGRDAVTVAAGSAIRAEGAIGADSSVDLTLAGDGALLRVSNGDAVTIGRSNVTGGAGVLTVADGATIAGGESLILDGTAAIVADPGALLSGRQIDVVAGKVSFVGAGSDATPDGFVVGEGTLAQFASSERISLLSRGAMDFHGNVAIDLDNALTLGGSAFTSDGGALAIEAPTVTFVNTVADGSAEFSAGSGTLTVAADEVRFGEGAKTLAGFGTVAMTARRGMTGEGEGSFDFGSLDVELNTPVFLADQRADTTLVTTGNLAVNRAEGTALDAAPLGGALTLTGGTLDLGTAMRANAGTVSLRATSGDLTLGDGALVDVSGVGQDYFDVTLYAPAGTINLVTDAGRIIVPASATLDFSGADGGGNAGMLNVSAPTQSLTLAGTLVGQAADGYRGGSFGLDTGGAVDLDSLTDRLAASGVDSAIAVHSRTGGLTLSAGNSIVASDVALTADATDGVITIAGTIDASGEKGGDITLYGRGGVDVQGRLLATGSADDERGGEIVLGTSGIANGTLDAGYGYQNVGASGSGFVRIGQGAVIDVSGGTSGGLSGGTLAIRAPLLETGDVRVDIANGATIEGARSITLEAYATWSTTDASTDAQHFDGIIDPAGWHDATGTLLPGSWTDIKGAPIAPPADAAQLADYLTRHFFTPDVPNADHQGFYGYANGDAAQGPGTLMGFVQDPGFAFESRFAGRWRDAGGADLFRAAPGIQLVNPSGAINGGDVSVLTHWNLGAGTLNPDGSITRVFRYDGDTAPILTLRAAADLNIRASISDGFFQKSPAPNLLGLPGDFSTALEYYNNNNFLVGFASTITLADGSTYTFDGGNSYYQTYQSPAENQSQKYYDIYAWTYTDYLSILWVVFQDGRVDYPYPEITPEIAQAVPKASDFQSYAEYGDAYRAWVTSGQFLPGSGLTPPPPEAPTNVSDYESIYAGLYFDYGIQSFNSGENGGGFYIYAPYRPPSDPAPPPQTVAGGNDPAAAPRTANVLPLQVASLVAGQSASYRLVAGTDAASANPLALERASAANVAVDGFLGLVDAAGSGQTIYAPTLIRTGTGSIDVAASADVSLANGTAPGVIYTAGAPAAGAPASDDISVRRPGNLYRGPTLLISGLATPEAAGDVSIAAGRDILGRWSATGPDGGQFWWTYLQGQTPAGQIPIPSSEFGIPGTGDNPDVSQVSTSASVNFANFRQGIMSIGGDVSLTAGRDVSDLSVALPSRWYLSDLDAYRAGEIAAPTINLTGGGDLGVTAGGNIVGGAYFVSWGEGNLQAGGDILPGSGAAVQLAVQDAQLAVAAGRSIEIGGIWNPSSYNHGGSSGPLESLRPDSQPYSSDSAVNVQSVSGDVRLLTTVRGGGGGNFPYDLPATIDAVAMSGSISIAFGGALYPSEVGQFSLIAADSIRLTAPQVTNLLMRGEVPQALPSILHPFGVATTLPISHAQDDDPVRIYARDGDIVTGSVRGAQGEGVTNATALVLSFPKPAQILAGHDIVNLSLNAQNYYASDVTWIFAGNDFYHQPYGNQDPSNGAYANIPIVSLGGPGTLLIEAGRNIGPLTSTKEAASSVTGIRTLATDHPDIPREGADIVMHFGIAGGVNTEGFGQAYLDPAVTGSDGLPDFSDELIAFVEQYNADALTRGGTLSEASPLTAEEAWTQFQALPEFRQRLFADRALFRIFETVAADYYDPDSPDFQKYARGYAAIGTLFPADWGYTANATEGGPSGSTDPVSTGNFDMRSTTVQTLAGGDITILGPGGRVLVGSTATPPFLTLPNGTLIGPNAMGILTLRQGDINVFTDVSVLLAQSRILTQQGGNVTMWSSNGDINAGKGAKTTSETPQPSFVCNVDYYCVVDPSGRVTGAGIGSLQTIPGAPTGDVYLLAPRGTINAGDAGIRVSGSIILAAQQVLNADNIQVQGEALGIPQIIAVNTGALTAASAATSAVTAQAEQLAERAKPQPVPRVVPTVVFGRFLGFGEN